MIGCPVDAIHRGKHQQIVIEDHCIGCGLCANNCPYGNIWILPDERQRAAPSVDLQPTETKMTAKVTAATCDLCDAEGKRDEPLPRCVYACPHDAAHRMSGAQLLQEVMKSAPDNS
jgi:Fe-S-cluster-containing hydrogenase component 2